MATVATPLSSKDRVGGNLNPAHTTATTGSMLSLRQVLEPPIDSVHSKNNTSILLKYKSHAPAWHCTFSKDGRYFAACFGAPNPCVRVWQVHDTNNNENNNDSNNDYNDTWTLQATLSDNVHERTIRKIAFAPVTTPLLILAAASFDGSISIWECKNNNDNNNKDSTTINNNPWECTTQLEGHENEVKDVTWNATGSLLATCGRDKTVWLWEAFLPGTIGGHDNHYNDEGDFDCIAVLNGHEGDVKCVTFAPSHNQWGTGDEIVISGGYDDCIKIWAEDAGDWYCAMSIDSVHSDTIWSLTTSPGGGRLVSASADGSIAILKCYTESEWKERFPNEVSSSSSTSPSNINSDSHGLWKCVGKLPGAHSSVIYNIQYASAKTGHGRLASCGGDNTIKIYREAMGSTSDEPKFLLDATTTTTSSNHGDVNCIAWHPHDGSILCSANDDGTIQVWNYSPA